jgi:hypothetical protein
MNIGRHTILDKMYGSLAVVDIGSQMRTAYGIADLKKLHLKSKTSSA